MLKSLRMVVLMGAMRSTRPVTTDVPAEVRSSTLSPTTKGRVTNCNMYQVFRYNCHTLHCASMVSAMLRHAPYTVVLLRLPQ